MKIKVWKVLTILVLTAGSAYAREGFSVGLDLGARGFISRDLTDDVDAGPAAGLNITWGVTDSLDIKFKWNGSMHIGEGLFTSTQTAKTSNSFSGASIGFGINFLTGEKLQPYIEAGIGAYRFGGNMNMMNRWNYGQEESFLMSWGVNAGTGFNYLIKEDVSTGIRLNYTYIPFAGEQVGTTKIIDGTNLSGYAGITYHFGRKFMPGCRMSHDKHNEATDDDDEKVDSLSK